MRPRRSGPLVLLGSSVEGLAQSLLTERYDVQRELVKGASAIVMTDSAQLTRAYAGLLRAALRSRGVLCVACEQERIVEVLLMLRRAGLEPKQAIFVPPNAAALVVARPAKRGGLVVRLAQGDWAGTVDAIT